MEINKTIVLNSKFCEYGRTIDLMMGLLPPNLRLKKENVYFEVQNKREIHKCKKVPETYSRTSGKKGITITIYDKTKELADVYKTEVKNNYLRFEIKLNCTQKIKNVLGENNIWRLSDRSIETYFEDFVKKNIEKPYNKYCVERDKGVLKLLKNHYSVGSRTWVRDVLIAAGNIELTNEMPCVIDIEDITGMLNGVKFTSRQCKYNAKKQFEKVAHEELNVLINYKSKYTEMLEKLE